MGGCSPGITAMCSSGVGRGYLRCGERRPRKQACIVIPDFFFEDVCV